MREKRNNNDLKNDIIKGVLAGAIAGIIMVAFDRAMSYQSEEDLEAELKKALASEDYEKCAVIRDKINELKK